MGNTMSTMLHVYLDPGSPTAQIDLSGMQVYGFALSETTSAVAGSNSLGELLFNKLSSEERRLLKPEGRVFEAHLEKRKPDELKRALFKYYELATRLFENETDTAISLIEKENARARGLDTLLFFKRLQGDIAGAVFICDLAIQQGKEVYWAVG